jgi:hypothetical protein
MTATTPFPRPAPILPMPDRAQAIGFLEHWVKLTGTVALVAIFKEKEERRPLQFHSYQPGSEEGVWS